MPAKGRANNLGQTPLGTYIQRLPHRTNAVLAADRLVVEQAVHAALSSQFEESLGGFAGPLAAASNGGLNSQDLWEAQASDFTLEDAEENEQPASAAAGRSAKKPRVQVRPDHLEFGTYTTEELDLIRQRCEKLKKDPKTPKFTLSSMNFKVTIFKKILL